MLDREFMGKSKDPDFMKKWRAAHPGYDRAHVGVCTDPNYHKNYYEKNKKEILRKMKIHGKSLVSKFTQLKSRAKSKGFDLTITFEDYRELVVDKLCTYCGAILPQTGFGLDRLNEDVGYVHGNCVPCCWSCNDRLGAFTRVGFSRQRALELLKELVNQHDSTKS